MEQKLLVDVRLGERCLPPRQRREPLSKAVPIPPCPSGFGEPLFPPRQHVGTPHAAPTRPWVPIATARLPPLCRATPVSII